jgi:hypothetical protein
MDLEDLVQGVREHQEHLNDLDYTATEKEWQDLRKAVMNVMETTTTTTVLLPNKNPYRINTQLHDLFELMKDGRARTLHYIIYEMFRPRETPIYRGRRIASALRTIRAYLRKNGLGTIRYEGPIRGYRMLPWPKTVIRTEAVGGSLPADARS